MAKRTEGPPADPVMGADFQPLRTLWEDEPTTYPSEQSARWAIRQLNERLAAVNALALHRGMLYVHRERFVQVAREHAVEQANARYGKKPFTAPAKQENG